MTSSLRTVSLDETLEKAREMAAILGIVRVTDTTWLDCIGIPVYSSIRPDANRRSLCVNAGKGVRPKEAQVGAFMEAIEFALAEFRNRSIDLVMATPAEVVEQKAARFRFLDLCPIMGREVEPNGPLACVESEDMATGQMVLVPAELAFSPFPENPAQRIFGTSTNGLSSGNSIAEATLHGLCELIERDVRSFNYFKDQSRLVILDEVPEEIQELVGKVQTARLQVALRWTPNAFDIPYLEGFILESHDDAPIAVSLGAGLHPIRDIAAVRGIAEAAQSRLSYIHGGRDDLIERFEYFEKRGSHVEAEVTQRIRAQVGNPENAVRYSRIADAQYTCDSIDSALEGTIQALASVGLHQVLRVVLSPPRSPLKVVKVIVPGLENFQPSLKRIGTRLNSFVAQLEEVQ
ncbi:YcaO-like family protein [Kitasatospora sp. NPDC052896]|uniref:YcaO-like family protein n=1 Tax=Kitasatospora sp. NPDC052896 TaxID=3364061 RepID=UPI0037C59193